MRIYTVLSILIMLLGSLPANAHQIDTVELEFLQTEGKWKLEGLLDIAYMLPESRGVKGAPPLYRNDVMAAPEAEHERITRVAEATLRKLLTLEYNGKALRWELRFPEFEKNPLILPPENGGWALMTAEITTTALPGPGNLVASWHDDQESELIVIVEEAGEIGLFPISSGMSETLLKVPASGNAHGSASEVGGTTPTRRTQAENWMISGYRHVIGPDHLLFIIGLFLLAPHLRPLMKQSLLFTLAHSITLALAIFGVISLPAQLVEILIAASIAWIGIENLFLRKLKPSRLLLVFGFGLLHGLGFASVLREKLGNLSGKQLALPLVGFNIGVELAQITALVVAAIILWPLRRWTQKIQFGGSLVIAFAGLSWMVERIFSLIH